MAVTVSAPFFMISNSTIKYINLAINQARMSDMKIKHGSTLVCNGKIVGQGYNHQRTSITGKGMHHGIPLFMLNSFLPSCSVHAEVHCLLSSLSSGHFNSLQNKTCFLSRHMSKGSHDPKGSKWSKEEHTSQMSKWKNMSKARYVPKLYKPRWSQKERSQKEK